MYLGVSSSPGYASLTGVMHIKLLSEFLSRPYIMNQKEYHRIASFEDELRALLLEHGIEFDEKYLFDD